MFSALMDKTISVERATTTKDAGGGTLRSFASVASGLTASIQPMRGSEQDLYLRRNITVDTTIYTEADLATLLTGGLKVEDRIIGPDGQKYVVRGGILPKSNTVISPVPLYQIACASVIS